MSWGRINHPGELFQVGDEIKVVMGQGEVSGYEASVVINRKDFGVDLDLPMETGGAVVGDKVTITLDIEAVKQA